MKTMTAELVKIVLPTKPVAGTVQKWESPGDEIRDALRRGSNAYSYAGLCFQLQKEALPHGGWLPWLEAEGFKPRTAQRMMGFYAATCRVGSETLTFHDWLEMQPGQVGNVTRDVFEDDADDEAEEEEAEHLARDRKVRATREHVSSDLAADEDEEVGPYDDAARYLDQLGVVMAGVDTEGLAAHLRETRRTKDVAILVEQLQRIVKALRGRGVR